LEIGKSIVETYRSRGLDPRDMPGVLCANHGPFAFGRDPQQAVYHAAVLEEVVRMALITLQISPDSLPIPDYLLEKHYRRKHGPHAYYGQISEGED
jgi:L-ribulose-5-phosphate 4-epimerase